VNIVGVMWAKNEADIIAETITDAMRHVDRLMIADDGSTDGTWEIVKLAQKFWPDKIEHIQQKPDRYDKGQRQALLDVVRQRYRPDDTWVQVIEADIFLLDTDVRAVCQAETKIGISWQTLNAVRAPGTWAAVDTYPHWTRSIREVMPLVHRIEVMLYTFRPLPLLQYDPATWRPWPQGFSHYVSTPLKENAKEADSPLLLHCGYRGPTHFYEKYKSMGDRHTKYPTWDLTTPEQIERTVAFFNGDWNTGAFEASRKGWQAWLKNRTG